VNLQLWVRGEARKILRGYKNELSVLHLFCDMDQNADRQLSGLCIEEHVKFIKYPEWSFQVLPERQKKRHGSVASFPATER
jgi:hypothetical protein